MPPQQGQTSLVWLLDSGAAKHICCRQWMFTHYTPFPEPKRCSGLGHSYALGSGTVPLVVQLPTSTKLIYLQNVLHVPSMLLNLICIDIFTKLDGVNYYQDKHSATITHTLNGTTTTILQGTPFGTHRKLEYSLAETMPYWSVPEDELSLFDSTYAFLSTVSKTPIPLLLFHKRMGHINWTACRKLAKSLNIPIQDPGDDITCPACVAGKGAA